MKLDWLSKAHKEAEARKAELRAQAIKGMQDRILLRRAGSAPLGELAIRECRARIIQRNIDRMLEKSAGLGKCTPIGVQK